MDAIDQNADGSLPDHLSGDVRKPEASGRSRSPPLKRVVTFDCDEKTVRVRTVKSIESKCPSIRFVSPLPLMFMAELDPRGYQKLKLERRRSDVDIFVNSETESEPTTDGIDSHGHSNVLLARLFLDRLGYVNNFLRHIRLLSMSNIYLTNVPYTQMDDSTQ